MPPVRRPTQRAGGAHSPFLALVRERAPVGGWAQSSRSHPAIAVSFCMTLPQRAKHAKGTRFIQSG